MRLKANIESINRFRGGELLVFAVFSTLMAIGVTVHEPWFDEAQSWLLARDAGVSDLCGHYLRYEGHPPLWYLLLKIPASLGFPYRSMNVIAAAITLGGVALLLLNRRIPFLIRAVLPFTYFVAYQYSIVARSYVLLFPILLGILSIYGRRRERLWLFVILLALLCQTSLYGMSIAFGLVLVYGIELIRGGFPRGRELIHHLAAAGVLLANCAAIAWMLRIPGDMATIHKLDFHFRIQRLIAILWHGLAVNLLGAATWTEAALSVIAFCILVTWFARRRTLLMFAVLILSLIPIGSVYFGVWHEGVFFIAIAFAILLTFTLSYEQRGRFDLAMIAIASLIFLKSANATLHAYRYDYGHPYSGSRAAAEFIRKYGIDHARMFGAGFSCLAVEPYFAHNIFANYQTKDGFSFWDWSSKRPWYYEPSFEMHTGNLEAWQTAQLRQRPDFVLVSEKMKGEEQYSILARSAGYRQIAYFPGAMIWKDQVIERESFRLFIRGDLLRAPEAH